MRKWMDALEGRLCLSAAPGSTFVVPPSATFHPWTNGSTNAIVTIGALPGIRISGIKVTHSGTLEIDGTARADSIAITIRNGRLISGNAFYFLDPSTSSGGTTISTTYLSPGLPATRIRRVLVNGLGGDDKITVDADVPVAVNGAKGNDMISVFAPSRKIDGGSGTDTITSEDAIV